MRDLYGPRFPTGPVVVNPNSWQARGLAYWAPLHDGVGRSTRPTQVLEFRRRPMTAQGTVTGLTYRRDGGVDFDGTAHLSGPESGLPAGSTDRTFTMWVRTTSTSGAPEFLFFQGTMGGGSQVVTAYFSGYAAPNKIVVWSQWGASFTSTFPADGLWHHLALTITGGSTWSVYVDGRYQTAGGMATNTASSGTFVLAAQADGSLRLQAASLRDVRVYAYALSPGQIRALVLDPKERFALWSDPLRRRPFGPSSGSSHKWYWAGPRYSGILGSGVA